MPDARKVWCLLAAAVVVSCGGAGGEPEAATTTAGVTTTSVEATTTTRVLSDEEAVLEAVEGYWRTIREANEDPLDPNHPGFDLYFADGPRETSVALVRERMTKGWAVRMPDDPLYMHTPAVFEINDREATVWDCSVDDTVVYEVATGRIIDDSVATIFWETVLVYEDRWRVKWNTILDEREEVAGCAAQ